jgi:hypothetical protein
MPGMRRRIIGALSSAVPAIGAKHGPGDSPFASPITDAAKG